VDREVELPLEVDQAPTLEVVVEEVLVTQARAAPHAGQAAPGVELEVAGRAGADDGGDVA
jgi:hypothetical protein